MSGARLALVAAAAGLAGCPGTVTRLDRLPKTTPLAAPVSIDAPGPLVHEATGFAFAEAYGRFRRVQALRYDTAGLHVGVGYDARRPGCAVVATFFLRPAPRMAFVAAAPEVVASVERGWLAEELARATAEIRAQHAVESPRETPAAAAPRGALLDGPSFVFEEGRTVSELRLQLYDHRWIVKSRFTYPASCAEEARRRLDALVPALPWEAADGGGPRS
ncbi:MAG TPA: hypothetical protein VFD84_17995 [Candidatus Binatia bacterium]|nr:hypothetical protein [Candidatus Binatia bacterium]